MASKSKTKLPELSVERINLSSHKSTRGFADLNISGLIVKGYRVVARDNGSLFVSNPSQPSEQVQEDGNTETIWYSTAYATKGNKALQNAISKVILNAYTDKLKAQVESE